MVYGQVTNEFEVREPTLKKYKELALELIKNFENIKINIINRNSNEEADALAKLGAVLSPEERKWIQIEKLLSPSILVISYEENDWRIPILKYLKGEKLDLEPIQIRKVKNQAVNFTTIKEELVKRNIRDSTLYHTCYVFKRRRESNCY